MARRTMRRRTLTEAISNSAVMNRALTKAVKEALEMHRRAGNEVAVLGNGKVVTIDSPKIPE
ncbi:MAG: hypothetical protein IT531_20185 [Burkholderiales bacterium]|nr:hypothetical protein [Burkholderiales bacterium]